MPDARLVREWDAELITLAASISVGEIWQLGSGKAGYFLGIPNGSGYAPVAGSSGDRGLFQTADKVTVTKATGVEFLNGGRVYWDHSANNATYKKANDRDFYIGRAVGAAASSDATLLVDLNTDPPYDIDLGRDPFLSTLVGTAAAGGFGYPIRLGGCSVLELTATSEAQKVDLLSVDGFAKSANAIVEGAFRIISDGSNATQDFNIGIANGTHASDADSITESLFIHVDGNSTNLSVESDDGTTEVAATDSTADYTEGSTISSRVEFWFDLANPADTQVYLNGANVLPGSTFNVDASVGPWYLLAHLEKTSSTDTYKVAIDWLRVRFMEQ